MKKIEKIGIKATEYPDWDYVINELMSLADKMNEIIELVNITHRPRLVIDAGGVKCDVCGEAKKDVSIRKCGFYDEIYNEVKMERICDDCEHEHLMDI